jgi:hypothetical protein
VIKFSSNSSLRGRDDCDQVLVHSSLSGRDDRALSRNDQVMMKSHGKPTKKLYRHAPTRDAYCGSERPGLFGGEVGRQILKIKTREV